jgi:hypothetical protein
MVLGGNEVVLPLQHPDQNARRKDVANSERSSQVHSDAAAKEQKEPAWQHTAEERRREIAWMWLERDRLGLNRLGVPKSAEF